MAAYKYKTAAGKQLWYVSFYYTDWTGTKKRKCKRGFATRREALDWETAFLNKGATDPSILFSALAENYLADMKTRLKPTTYYVKSNTVNNIFVTRFGSLPICDIDSRMVRLWQNELMDYRDEDGKPYSATYLSKLHKELSAIFNYAVKYYHLAENPCKLAGSIGKGRATEMNIWTEKQFERFLSFENKPQYQLAFNILFYTGMREGELLALTAESLLRDERSLRVNKNFAIVDGVEMFLTPKSEASIRDVAIDQALYEDILAWIELLGIQDDERLFIFGRSALQHEMRTVLTKAELPRIRVHDLRHSHASMLIEMGVPVTEIAKRLGHDSPATTLRVYSHLYPGKERNIADLIDKRRSEKPEK